MASEGIRVGLIGAGRNTRDRHIPGFHEVNGVEIVAVANRSRESGRQAADQFNIPTVYDNWQELLEDPTIDAVCIGTWPYMHRVLTISALEAGKHVLCEARMAATAQEAHDMLDASRARPDLVTQIVPSPLTFKVDNLLQQKIAEGYVGDILAVSVQSLAPAFMEAGGPMHWRNDRDLSGFNILNMGIWYEAMIRWVGRANNVMAMTSINASHRTDEAGNRVPVSIPDHVDILAGLANGAQANLRFSAVTGLRPGERRLDLRRRGNPAVGLGVERLGRQARRTPADRIPQSRRRTSILAGRRGVLQRHTRPGKNHPHPLRRRRPLHGVHRGRHPQRPDRTSGRHCRYNASWAFRREDSEWERSTGPVRSLTSLRRR